MVMKKREPRYTIPALGTVLLALAALSSRAAGFIDNQDKARHACAHLKSHACGPYLQSAASVAFMMRLQSESAPKDSADLLVPGYGGSLWRCKRDLWWPATSAEALARRALQMDVSTVTWTEALVGAATWGQGCTRVRAAFSRVPRSATPSSP
jgi:hypothetical protein